MRVDRVDDAEQDVVDVLSEEDMAPSDGTGLDGFTQPDAAAPNDDLWDAVPRQHVAGTQPQGALGVLYSTVSLSLNLDVQCVW